MTVSITPYLQFDGNARQAVEFYQSVFGGQLDLSTFAEGMGGQADEASADLIMHASLFVERGFHLMASDVTPGMPAGANGTQSLSSDGADATDDARLREYWDKLSADASIDMPLEVAPWGDAFGVLTDKFGVSWMMNITAPQV